MSLQVYIVMASQGDWEDRTTWPVCAYLDEAVAREHVRLAEDMEREARLIEWEPMPTSYRVDTIPLYDAVVPVIGKIVAGEG